ncbi:LysR family transcriptional regulator [Phreatobacter oligotrophus]|uniref:DNA-binding transcriptional LysR family regulator n=1 Tax=Phreatobacter oligotrophus TaxID=1122261 RepID=A0A2T4Z2M7_9HYPH|nr:LysR substrate-binding domain-containing protein [Phreatobacter oligotrophus]PTM55024.1 DNA-binding transcriptional LysR family regulator [Phreatobacter oligotrophus]
MIDFGDIDTGAGMDWLDHHLLTQFLVVAEEGQVSRAAARLGIEQPPLSRALQKLELRVGARLLARRPRGVELTEAGRLFRDGALRLLADADRLAETTRQTARGERGRLVIGVTATSALHAAVQDRLGRFRACYPDIALTLQEGQSAQLVDALRGASLDAAFLWTPPADGLSTCDMTSEPLVAAVPEAVAQRLGTGPIRIAALADATFIVYGRRDGFGLFAATIAACHRAGFSPRFGAEAARLSAAVAMVGLGLGVVLLPQTLRMIAHPGVVYLPFAPEEGLTTELRLVMPLQPGGEAAAKFRRFIMASAISP